MRTYFVLDSDVSESMERQATKAYNKAHERDNLYDIGYAQAVSDVLEFALRRQEWKEIVDALNFISEEGHETEREVYDV